jgi:hypothetical protein
MAQTNFYDNVNLQLEENALNVLNFLEITSETYAENLTFSIQNV